MEQFILLSVYSEAHANVNNGFFMKPYFIAGFIIFIIVVICAGLFSTFFAYKTYKAKSDAELLKAKSTLLAAQAQFAHAQQKDVDSVTATALRTAFAKVKSPEDVLSVVDSAEQQAHSQLLKSPLFDDDFTIESEAGLNHFLDRMAEDLTSGLQSQDVTDTIPVE